MLRSSFHSVPSGFAQFVARKFGRGPFLAIGPEREELEQHFEAAGVAATAFASPAELTAALPQNGNRPRADLAIWFYPAEKKDDQRAAEALAACAETVLLLPAAGVEIAHRRPHLVECFGRAGLQPDYECDLGELDPGRFGWCESRTEPAEALVPAVESAFARLNRHVHGLERTLRTRLSELDAADRHISKLEEKLLKLKEAKLQLKQLKAEKQALRKSPERKIGQVVLAPYRLPQKLVREVRKRFPKRGKSSRASAPASEYQAWFEARRVKPDDFPALRDEIRAFDYQPCVSIITPVFNTPVNWLEECVRIRPRPGLRKMGADSGRRRFDRPRAAQGSCPSLAARDARIILAKDRQARRYFRRVESRPGSGRWRLGRAFSITTTSSNRMRYFSTSNGSRTIATPT